MTEENFCTFSLVVAWSRIAGGAVRRKQAGQRRSPLSCHRICSPPLTRGQKIRVISAQMEFLAGTSHAHRTFYVEPEHIDDVDAYLAVVDAGDPKKIGADIDKEFSI